MSPFPPSGNEGYVHNRDVTNILQNIFFYAQQKKETSTGLEQLEGEYMITQFLFLEELSP